MDNLVSTVLASHIKSLRLIPSHHEKSHMWLCKLGISVFGRDGRVSETHQPDTIDEPLSKRGGQSY